MSRINAVPVTVHGTHTDDMQVALFIGELTVMMTAEEAHALGHTLIHQAFQVDGDLQDFCEYCREEGDDDEV